MCIKPIFFGNETKNTNAGQAKLVLHGVLGKISSFTFYYSAIVIVVYSHPDHKKRRKRKLQELSLINNVVQMKLSGTCNRTTLAPL